MKKVVIGLGNPGPKFDQTRHNVGFFVADRLALALAGSDWSFSKKCQAWVCQTQTAWLVKPHTYMNQSGQAVRAFCQYYAKEDFDAKNLYVVHDDLDLALGSFKIQLGRGPKTHGGLNSIYAHLGTKDFWHVRVGIDNREPGQTGNPQTYVLGKFPTQEQAILRQASCEVVARLQAALSLY